MTMKFRAHETFFIRKGWLSKGMKNVKSMPDIFVTKEENPMDILGIGANMVKSLRYWLQATGLTEERKTGKHIQVFTEFGNLVYDNDRYLEELGTLLLIQYKIASNKELATAWYYFFNEFNLVEFSREEFVSKLQSYVLLNGENVANRSLNDDFACIINTYLPRYKTSAKRVSPENNIDCPLGELGLIDNVNKTKKTFRKTMPRIDMISPWVILAVIMDQAGDEKEIALNDLLKAPCNIGRVFNLDVIGMIDVLHQAEKMDAIKIIRTAGLDIVRINKRYTFIECVQQYYDSINRRIV